MALGLFLPSLTPPIYAVSRVSTRSAPPRPVKPPPNLLKQAPVPLLSQLALSADPSPSNSALNCEHFETCSGCTHEWNLGRPQILQEVASFFRENGVPDATFDSGRLWEWRCRAKLAVRGTVEKPLIGLYQEGTHNVVDIPSCRAHHPSINLAVDLLKEGISALNVQPYDEDQRTGELRYVQMSVTTYDTSLPAADRYMKGKVQVTVVWNSRSETSPSFEKLNSLCNFMWKSSRIKSDIIHSIWANFQTSSNNVIFGNRWRHLLGEAEFWERLGGVDICLAPSSFAQANSQAFDSLLRKLQKYVPYGASVVDLYAGAGIIGLSLAVTRKCRTVRCVEINKESKLSFEKSLSRLPKITDSSISWHHADASIDSLHWLEGADVVIVDPPRKGLDSSLIDALRTMPLTSFKSENATRSLHQKEKEEKRPWVLRSREASIQVESKTSWEMSKSWPHTLIYISCGWESFKEDCCSLLSNKAWRLEKAHAFNFFPGTQGIEVLAIFKRGPVVSSKKKKKKGKKRPLK